VRHLHGELAARLHLGDQPAEQRRMIVQPMQGGIAEEEVGGLRRRPLRQVGLNELDLGEFAAGRGQHPGR
jgi:hypothetical protein